MQSLETKSSRPSPKSFETETETRLSRPRLPKTGLETRLETETISQDSITAVVTRTSPNLKQKFIVTLVPGRTDPRILPRRPISIKLISRTA